MALEDTLLIICKDHSIQSDSETELKVLEEEEEDTIRLEIIISYI